MRAYVELRTDPDGESSARAWAFDLSHWGISRTAETMAGALSALQRATDASAIELEEVVSDFDPAFSRDLEPARPGERAATLAILGEARRRTLELVRSATEDQLTRPSEWAPHVDSQGWPNALELAWSLADVESRVYLPALGLPARDRLDDLVDELGESHAHVMATVQDLPDVVIRATADGGEWTSVKLLRLLAWRERSLVPLLAELIDQGR